MCAKSFLGGGIAAHFSRTTWRPPGRRLRTIFFSFVLAPIPYIYTFIAAIFRVCCELNVLRNFADLPWLAMMTDFGCVLNWIYCQCCGGAGRLNGKGGGFSDGLIDS